MTFFISKFFDDFFKSTPNNTENQMKQFQLDLRLPTN